MSRDRFWIESQEAGLAESRERLEEFREKHAAPVDVERAGYDTLRADADVVKPTPIMDGDDRPRFYCAPCKSAVLKTAWDEHVARHAELENPMLAIVAKAAAAKILHEASLRLADEAIADAGAAGMIALDANDAANAIETRYRGKQAEVLDALRDARDACSGAGRPEHVRAIGAACRRVLRSIEVGP